MSKKSGGGWSLNKISFWSLTVIALMYLVAQILRWIDSGLAGVAEWIGAVAAALAICLVAILAWRYVDSKPVVWKVLYFIVLLIVVVFIILPRVLI